MKLLIVPLLILGGAGWLGLGPSTDAAAQDCEGCRASVECTPDGTCVVVCRDADGVERCRQEVPCDRSCESPRECAGQTDCAASSENCAR